MGSVIIVNQSWLSRILVSADVGCSGGFSELKSYFLSDLRVLHWHCYLCPIVACSKIINLIINYSLVDRVSSTNKEQITTVSISR